MSRKVTFSDGRYWWVPDAVADEIERLQELVEALRREIAASGPLSNTPHDQAEQDTPDAA